MSDNGKFRIKSAYYSGFCLFFGPLAAGLLFFSAPLLSQESPTPSDTPAAEVPSASATPAPAEDTGKIDVMKNVLLSETVEQPLRQDQARELLKDQNAHPALIEILNSDQNISAKIIICQTIAAKSSQLLPSISNNSYIPATFIDPLFKNLKTENPELSDWAAKALVRCHDGVPARLAQMVQDANVPQPHRLNAIAALELIPGREPILALANLLDAAQPQPIRDRAAQAIASALYLPQPLDIQSFQADLLKRIAEMDPEIFLYWQIDRIRIKLYNAESDILTQRNQSTQRLQKNLELLTDYFNLLNQPDTRFNFLNKQLQNQPEQPIRIWVMQQIALWTAQPNIKSSEVAPKLVQLISPLISDPDPQLRQFAAASLENLSAHAPDAPPALLQQLSVETDPPTQAAILKTLGKFEYSPATEQALILLEAPQQNVVAQAARTLGKISETKNSPVPAETIAKIAQALAAAYQKPSTQSTDAQTEIIQAMGKIAKQEDHLKLAVDSFNQILKTALADESADIRSQAVYVLTQLHKKEVLPFLLTPANLLEDQGIVVRFAALDAIELYPDTTMLTPLRNRLAREDNSDVAKLIRSAFTKILAQLPIAEIYKWAGNLKSATGTEEVPLFNQSVVILADKLNQAKTANQTLPVDYEILVRTHQAELALKENQPAQAINFYQSLLELKLTDEPKDQFNNLILQIALDHADNQAILNQAKTALNHLLSRPAPAAVLQKIADTCNKYQADETLLIRSGNLIAVFIIPLKKYPTDQTKADWETRRIETALKLIDLQVKLLSAETPADNPKITEVLTQLDSRLSGYPAQQTPEKRRTALQRFRNILKPPPPAKPEPAPEPAPEADTAPPAEAAPPAKPNAPTVQPDSTPAK